MPERIIVVSPNRLERRRLTKILSETGYGVSEAESAVEALLLTIERKPDLIVLAEKIPPLPTLDLIQVIRQIATVPIIVVGSGTESVEIDYLEMGADYYQKRPVDERVFAARCRALIRRRRGSTGDLARFIGCVEKAA